MSEARRRARLERASSRDAPENVPPARVPPADVIEEEPPSSSVTVLIDPEIEREACPDTRTALAFDVGLRSLSWCVARADQEPRGMPSKKVKIEEWVLGRGDSGPWSVLAWDWTDVLEEFGYVAKKAKRAPETVQSKAIARALLRRTKEMRLLEVTDIVVECQDNRNPVMRAVARSILTFFDTWYGVIGLTPPAIYSYTGARKMQGIAAIDGCAACPARKKKAPKEVRDECATPPPAKRGHGARGRRKVAQSASKKDYDARKDRSVRASDRVIELGLIADPEQLRHFAEQKVHFRKKQSHAGDDMADALWHALSHLWRVGKPSIKKVPVGWGDVFENDM